MVLSSEATASSRWLWLLRAQNPDGGWGYSPGKGSWLEPTVYVMRALAAGAREEAKPKSYRQAQHYIDGLQRPDGAWQASALVTERHWSGALWMDLERAPRERNARWHAGLDWLLAQKGSEGGWRQHVAAWLDPEAVEQDLQLRGWPWLEGSSSWIEPTCHAMLSLRRAEGVNGGPRLTARLDEGRRLLLDRRCRDGGWNYGNRRVRGHDLPSYPQTTALALLTLKRCGGIDLQPSLKRAQQFWADPSLPRLARVWLALALRELGCPVALEEVPTGIGQPIETITVALESVACSPGGYA